MVVSTYEHLKLHKLSYYLTLREHIQILTINVCSYLYITTETQQFGTIVFNFII